MRQTKWSTARRRPSWSFPQTLNFPIRFRLGPRGRRSEALLPFKQLSGIWQAEGWVKFSVSRGYHVVWFVLEV